MNRFCKVNWPKGLRSFKSTTIQLSKEVVDYLKEDGIMVNSIWRKGEQQADQNGPRFPDLEKIINEILEEYESVFIKVNWKAPLDCNNWLQDMQCYDMYDIMMAIKCSGIIMEMIEDYDEDININHDQCKIIKDNGSGYLLELRKFYRLNYSREFRCFVRDHKLIAISQRNLYMITEDQSVKDKIQKYFESIQHLITMDQYVLDLYIDIPPKENIIVVDINPWQEHTRPKLFDYDELNKLEECELRLVSNKNQIIQEDYSGYRECLDLETFIAQQQQQ